MTRSALPALVLVVGAGLSACGGGDDGTPTDASVEEFCEAHQGFTFDRLGDELPSEEEIADAMSDWGDELAAVGTPQDIPDEARAGFELVVDRARDGEAFGEGGEPGPEVEAFYAYAAETCGPATELGLPDVPELPAE